MSRNGSGVYSLPPGSTVTNGDTSDATDLNTPLADIAADLNVARPMVAGGTGATSADGALDNFGGTTTGKAVFKGDASAGRTALGVVKQTSVTDDTAGSLMIVGAFGLGSDGVNVSDLDDLTETGFYRVSASSTNKGGSAGTAGTVIHENWDSTSGQQIYTVFFPMAYAGNTYTRHKISSTWSSWKEVLTAPAASAGDIFYHDGSLLQRLAKGTAGQTLRMNSGATAPEWGSSDGVPVAEVATTSGTTVDILTGIPAGVKKIELIMREPSLNANVAILVQLGTASSYKVSGYNGFSGVPNNAFQYTKGQGAIYSSYAGDTYNSGMVTLNRVGSSNVWVMSGTVGNTASGYTVDLGAELTRVRVASDNGTATFDNGGVSARYYP